ncbi:MAG TPA: nucleotidyltransferase domain-containing protein [Nitrospirae bacterium]|nr:nucleotidyltransferase domain-containing protein [Nitrospirota bacterium]
MTALERKILERFKSLLQKKLSVHKIVLFGSRARGDSTEYSDMDVLVVLDKINSKADRDYVSECAWEAGFEHGIVIVPVVYSRDEWENSPERSSLLAMAIEKEGVPI